MSIIICLHSVQVLIGPINLPGHKHPIQIHGTSGILGLLEYLFAGGIYNCNNYQSEKIGLISIF